MKTLDRIDKGLLKILQDDARITYAEIAKKLGIAESTVRFRVKRLVDRGIITRFTALINPRKAGFSIALIAMVKVNSKKLNEVFNSIVSNIFF